MNAVDTNVLLYVHDPRDPAKQTLAASLVRSLTDAALLWQVACEYLAASRKLAAFGYPGIELGRTFANFAECGRRCSRVGTS
jgi:hypothetical protein